MYIQGELKEFGQRKIWFFCESLKLSWKHFKPFKCHFNLSVLEEYSTLVQQAALWVVQSKGDCVFLGASKTLGSALSPLLVTTAYGLKQGLCTHQPSETEVLSLLLPKPRCRETFSSQGGSGSVKQHFTCGALGLGFDKVMSRECVYLILSKCPAGADSSTDLLTLFCYSH